MTNSISKAIAHINSLLKGFQVKRFLAIVAVGFLLLTTNVDTNRSNKSATSQVRDKAEQIDSVRPKTTGDWTKEARQTKDSPGERVENIVEETGQAFKEFGSLYPDTAKRSARDLND